MRLLRRTLLCFMAGFILMWGDCSSASGEDIKGATRFPIKCAGPVRSLAVSREADLVAAGSNDAVVLRCSFHQPGETRRESYGGLLFDLDARRCDGRAYLVVLSSDPTKGTYLRLCTAEGSVVATLVGGFGGQPGRVRFSPDGKRLAFCNGYYGTHVSGYMGLRRVYIVETASLAGLPHGIEHVVKKQDAALLGEVRDGISCERLDWDAGGTRLLGLGARTDQEVYYGLKYQKKQPDIVSRRYHESALAGWNVVSGQTIFEYSAPQKDGCLSYFGLGGFAVNDSVVYSVSFDIPRFDGAFWPAGQPNIRFGFPGPFPIAVVSPRMIELRRISEIGSSMRLGFPEGAKDVADLVAAGPRRETLVFADGHGNVWAAALKADKVLAWHHATKFDGGRSVTVLRLTTCQWSLAALVPVRCIC